MSKKSAPLKDFRADINALRAIAVFGVICFHYHLGPIVGGYAGVDVFFVISGYLMTRIVINGIEKNKFSFGEFYGRRLRRIVPALLFLLVAVTVAGFLFYFPNDYRLNEKYVAASAVFLSNVLYWRSSDYFAPASGDNILLHTWSLSVEWQFYLLYPVLLIGLNKLVKTRKSKLIVFIISTLALFAVSMLWTKADPTASFYLLPSRAWEMVIGGVAFLGQDYVKNFKGRGVLAILGYLAIAYVFVFVGEGVAWPGYYTLIPVLATFAIIITNVDFKFLQFPGVQYLGKISYSLYLWHWPVYVMLQYGGVEITGYKAGLMLTALALVLAYISYTFIESKNYQKNTPILALGLVMFVVALSLNYVNSNTMMFKDSTIKLAAYKDINHTVGEKKKGAPSRCWISSKTTDFNEAECLSVSQTQQNILLVGDSHGLQFSSTFKEEFKQRNINLLQATASGCFPLLKAKGEAECGSFMKYVYDGFIRKNAAKIDGVIICGNWVAGYNDSTVVLNDLKATLSYLDSLHVKAVIVGQNETYSMDYPYVAARESEAQINLDNKYLTKESATINRYLKQNLKDNYIDVYTYGKEAKVKNNVPYISDRNHLSTYGAKLAMKKIVAHPGFNGMVK